MLKKLCISTLLGLFLLPSMQVAAAETKIGAVNAERIMRESASAIRAGKKIEKEFEKRTQDLQRLQKQLQTAQEALEKNSVTMSEAEKRNKEREFGELSRDFQRKQREFNEDINQRRNEELAALFERVNKAIRQIAEQEKYDIILQEAAYINPRIDITDKVIKALGDAPSK